jgi:pimeloyl-ACP methyl ester carboxylesterase
MKHYFNSLFSPSLDNANSEIIRWSSRSWKDKIPDHEMKLTVDPTLAVFGDDDVFVSVKRLRSWADRLSEASKGSGKFRYAEISGAGHFWQDYEAVKVLQEEVRAFVQTL